MRKTTFSALNDSYSVHTKLLDYRKSEMSCTWKALKIQINVKCQSGYVQVPVPLQVQKELEMWANAQRDGRPAEYRWSPLFNAARFG